AGALVGEVGEIRAQPIEDLLDLRYELSRRLGARRRPCATRRHARLPLLRLREQIASRAPQGLRLEGLHQIRVRAELEAPQAIALRAFGRDDQQRAPACTRGRLY